MKEKSNYRKGFWDFACEHPVVTFILGEEIVRAVVCITVGVAAGKTKDSVVEE